MNDKKLLTNDTILGLCLGVPFAIFMLSFYIWDEISINRVEEVIRAINCDDVTGVSLLFDGRVVNILDYCELVASLKNINYKRPNHPVRKIEGDLVIQFREKTIHFYLTQFDDELYFFLKKNVYFINSDELKTIIEKSESKAVN